MDVLQSHTEKGEMTPFHYLCFLPYKTHLESASCSFPWQLSAITEYNVPRLHCTIFSLFLAAQALVKPIKIAQVPYLLYSNYIIRIDVGFLLTLEDCQMIMEVNCHSAS